MPIDPSALLEKIKRLKILTFPNQEQAKISFHLNIERIL